MMYISKINLSLLIGLSLLSISFVSTSWAVGDRVYKVQMKRLLKPSKIVKKAEQLRHSVFIYEGLRESDIDTVMDQQFDRIENMMFVRTLMENDEGEEEVMDDGCD